MQMANVIQIGAAVATPLGLLGLMATLGYYLYSRHLKHEEKKLDALPPGERARAVDRHLSRYGIDGTNIASDDRARLIFEEMDKKYRFARLCTVISAFVFVICFGLASVAFVQTSPSGDPPSRGMEELRDQFEALQEREKASNAKLESLMTKMREGDAGQSTPEVQQIFDDMEEKVETQKEGQRLSNATLGAIIEKVETLDDRRPRPELARFMMEWNKNVNPSDSTVEQIIRDPSLSVEDKITLATISIMQGMDRAIEEQVALVNSIQRSTSIDRSASIDVETMKLKRLIDKRSHAYDMLRQIIDKYNQTAKGIIDSMGR